MRVLKKLNRGAGTENMYLRVWFDSSSEEVKPVGKCLPELSASPALRIA
jgi:hypothetical protein